MSQIVDLETYSILISFCTVMFTCLDPRKGTVVAILLMAKGDGEEKHIL